MSILPVANILAQLAPIYTDQGVAATYWHHTGTTRVGGANTDNFTKFSVTVLGGKGGKKFKTRVTGEVEAQAREAAYHFRVSDLPAGIEPKDLTQNDRVEVGSQIYGIKNIRWVEGLAVRIAIEGG